MHMPLIVGRPMCTWYIMCSHTPQTNQGAQTFAETDQARDTKRKWSQETLFPYFGDVDRFVPFTEDRDKDHGNGILVMAGSLLSTNLHSTNLCKICHLHRRQWLAAEQNRGKTDTITKHMSLLLKME